MAFRVVTREIRRRAIITVAGETDAGRRTDRYAGVTRGETGGVDYDLRFGRNGTVLGVTIAAGGS